MACIDFDASDYLDEISTAELVSELARRKCPPVRDLAEIRDALERAWYRRDMWAYMDAVRRIESPDEVEARASRIKDKWKNFQSER